MLHTPQSIPLGQRTPAHSPTPTKLFVRLSKYWHHFCAPQFNSRNVKWLCHFPDMWWCAATGPIVHRGRDELAQRDQEATTFLVGPAALGALLSLDSFRN